MISHEKSAKIENRRSSRHVLLKSTWRDDRRFASWRIIITDIQRGNIVGLVGRNQSLPKFAVFALDSSHFSSPTLWGVFPREHDFFMRELWRTPPTTNFPMQRPTDAALQRALYSAYYAMCCAKAGVATQLCSWIYGLPLQTGHSDDTRFIADSKGICGEW